MARQQVIDRKIKTDREFALKAGRRLVNCDRGDEIVISGFSGSFPNTDGVSDLAKNLFNKIDLTSDDNRRWNSKHPEIPKRGGKLNQIHKFDAAFFGIHYKQAHIMDPMCRIILEKSYEAVVDSGYSPKSLKGSKTGVFVGTCFVDAEKIMYANFELNGFGLTGCTRAIYANRISYWLGINGPSYTVDCACSSSSLALEHAYISIRSGHCDSALVGGCNLCLDPYISMHCVRLGMVCRDGRSKPFDDGANGYSRSEAICVLYLQKAKNAKRVYARVVHAKSNCDGYKEEGITYPSVLGQQKLLEEFYEECEIKPSNVEWVEAHATGTKVGDLVEVQCMENVFCPGRKGPLLVGSIKSNLGHTEPVSGLCAIAKAIIAMETGFIPPNINFKTPRKDITAFHNGRMKVITENTPWNGGMVAINSFGFGGGNCHVLLNWNEKSKINNGIPEDDLPRLVVASGRTQEAVTIILNDFLSRPLDKEYVRLLQDIQSEQIPGHIYRGYTIITKDPKNNHSKYFKYYSGKSRPVCFLFSGMSSQWSRKSVSLLKLPIFNESILKSHNTLKYFGIDLIQLISDKDLNQLNNTVYSFVATTAIQIALFDVLVTIGITPDFIIGHSIGELGRAYADGCLTAEQIIKVSYYYALLCTISDLKESEEKCIHQLKSLDILTQKLNTQTFNQSSFNEIVIPSLLNELDKIILNSKPRTKKWISVSVSEESWEKYMEKYFPAKYYIKNLFNCELLNEILDYVPLESVLIELAPNGVFENIFNQKSLKNITYVDLPLRNHDNGLEGLLSAVGKMFEAGLNPKISKLYPDIEFPVSRGTPMIAPLVRWDHSEDWSVTKYNIKDDVRFSISLNDKKYEYLSDHIVNGRILFPGTGLLVMAWETLASSCGELYSELSVVFENINFRRATYLPNDGNVEFIVMIQKSSGIFEIVESGAPVITGRIYIPSDVNKEMINMPTHLDEPNSTDLNTKDIYKELRLRGYNYKGLFRSLNRINLDANVGRAGWFNNWVAFMDNMAQLKILNEDSRSLLIPTSLQRLVINTKKHSTIVETYPENNLEIPIYFYPEINLIQSGGIEFKGLNFITVAKRKPVNDPVLEKYVFVPNIIKMNYTLEEIVRVSIHIVIENLMENINSVEILDKTFNPELKLISPIILNVLADFPLIQPNISILIDGNHPQLKEIGTNINIKDKKSATVTDHTISLAIGSGLLENIELLKQVFTTLKPGGFLLTREQFNITSSISSVDVCLDASLEHERIFLVRKPLEHNVVPHVIKISNTDFLWLPALQKILKEYDGSTEQKIILVAEKDPKNGIIGLFNCIRDEPGGERTRCVFIMDECAPNFSLDDPFYKVQLQKDLALNVCKNTIWGSYRHLLLEPSSSIGVQHACVNTTIRGDLSSLKWLAGSLIPYTNNPGEPEIVHVYYSSLNSRDIMLATAKLTSEAVVKGRINVENVIGIEYSGRTETGSRVMGMVSYQGITNLVNCDPYLLWKVPDNWSLEEAATVTVAYATAIYALIVHGRMERGNSVLIHDGTDGVGQAAITLALYYGCEVFTTVETSEKRNFIKSHFPQVLENHIGSSKDTSFEQMIMMETNGKGVDMVLSSLVDEKLLASVRCLATGGRFLQIGKIDLANNLILGMEIFLKEISFHGIALETLFNGPKQEKLELQRQVQQCINSGVIKPIVYTIFEKDQIEQAFRYMSENKHIGKVLIKVRHEEKERFIKPLCITTMAYSRITFDQKSSCIICGGLGGFGLELADWLVLRNSRKIVLSSRTGIHNGYQAMRKRIWESYGAEIVISTADITTEEGVNQLLNEANNLGPVSAIFNLAWVVRDAFVENQTEDHFIETFGPKSIATSLLDKYSRTMCPKLKHFVMFSSISCGRGYRGQTSYGMSNSIMERICEVRQSEGLPALAIQWGPIGDVGYMADRSKDNEDFVIAGYLQQKVDNCLEIMDDLLIQKNLPIVCSMIIAEKHASNKKSVTIVDTVFQILGYRDLEKISLKSTLSELGMDSMMSAEIRQTLERKYELFLTLQEIKNITFEKLKEIETLRGKNE